jgi:hypothetical protein
MTLKMVTGNLIMRLIAVAFAADTVLFGERWIAVTGKALLILW